MPRPAVRGGEISGEILDLFERALQLRAVGENSPSDEARKAGGQNGPPDEARKAGEPKNSPDEARKSAERNRSPDRCDGTGMCLNSGS